MSGQAGEPRTEAGKRLLAKYHGTLDYDDAIDDILAIEAEAALRAAPEAEPGLDDRYIDRVKVFGSSVEEIRYALTYLDDARPGWRAALRGDT